MCREWGVSCIDFHTLKFNSLKPEMASVAMPWLRPFAYRTYTPVEIRGLTEFVILTSPFLFI